MCVCVCVCVSQAYRRGDKAIYLVPQQPGKPHFAVNFALSMLIDILEGSVSSFWRDSSVPELLHKCTLAKVLLFLTVTAVK